LLHLTRDGNCDRQPASTPPLGVTALDDEAFDSIAMAPGDLLAVPSDGLFEQPNEQNERFGVDRLVDVLRAHRDQPLAELSARVQQAVADFAGRADQGDDMSILLVRREP
jgi:serine phosphatase RsbU (regulator of sigma subunit)